MEVTFSTDSDSRLPKSSSLLPTRLQGTGKIQNPTWKLFSLLTVTADIEILFSLLPKGNGENPKSDMEVTFSTDSDSRLPKSFLPTGNGENPKSYMEVTFSTDSDSRLPKSSTLLIYLNSDPTGNELN